MTAHTDTSIVIAAPVDEVWRCANDLSLWPRLFSDEYQSVEVLRQEADYVRFVLTTVPEAGRSYTWESERFLDRAAGTVTARRLTPGPFRYMHIFQQFQPHAEGTKLRWVQDFEVGPGAPLTEAAFAERIESGSRKNLAKHKEIIEANGASLGPLDAHPAPQPGSWGHIDVRVIVDAPRQVVWDVANDRKAWARGGHPVHAAEDFGEDSTFSVTTPPDRLGRSWSFTVHRIRDDAQLVVFSRRIGCPDFTYNVVWFSYDEVEAGTEMRCISDFEMADGATVTAEEMERIMSDAMRKNLQQVAGVAQKATTRAAGERL